MNSQWLLKSSNQEMKMTRDSDTVVAVEVRCKLSDFYGILNILARQN